MPTVRLQLLTCARCALTWTRPVTCGRPPTVCDNCRTVPRPRSRPATPGRPARPQTPGYRLALMVTTYRLAIEEATAALHLGRAADALTALRRAQAPGRQTAVNRNNRAAALTG